ncbi:Protein CutA, chloroplastic [Porphyridium purpureum]|uniref:Protein CutA, chloroplastic n=1 Tax=Porphyridium purpureum TaxID=35688 RepID=A0A5J4Z9R7_PORPP|nr:Protein CutA, chloroplastic [Porphyridium purpureum]|eukprot:POR1598..scf295_1
MASFQVRTPFLLLLVGMILLALAFSVFFSLPTRYLLVHVTVPDAETSDKIARELIDAKLAACINVLPVQSKYRWDGEYKESSELLMLIKTRASLFHDVSQHIRQLHPAELPEIIGVSVDKGLFEYLEWVRTSTRPPY